MNTDTQTQPIYKARLANGLALTDAMELERQRDQYKAHADKLAEALRDMMHDLDIFYAKYRESGNKYLANAKAALAEWGGRTMTTQDYTEADADFFAEAFTHPVTREPYALPENLKRLSVRLCRSYGIRGVCDPMYIANVIAVELGLGDGLSNFNTGESNQ